MKNLCTVPDKFLKNKPLWIVTLSNGTKIYQDDHRPGHDPPQAWLRLKESLQDKLLTIEQIHIAYNDKEKLVAGYEKGYTFTQAAEAIFFSETLEFYVFGLLREGRLLLKWYKMPELFLYRKTSKQIDKYKKVLIHNEIRTHLPV